MEKEIDNKEYKYSEYNVFYGDRLGGKIKQGRVIGTLCVCLLQQSSQGAASLRKQPISPVVRRQAVSPG